MPFVFIRAYQAVANPLMRTAFVIVSDVFCGDVIKVDETEHDEVIEVFVLQALNPLLDEGVQVRCPVVDWFYMDGPIREHPLECGGVVPVVITHDRSAAHSLDFGMQEKRGGLPFHPGGVRLERRRSNEHFASGHMNEDHGEYDQVGVGTGSGDELARW